MPAGSRAGRKLRIKGKGLPAATPGDLYLVLEIVLPPAATDKARQLYETMAREMARQQIPVNVVCPGPTATALLDNLAQGEKGERIKTKVAEPVVIAPSTSTAPIPEGESVLMPAPAPEPAEAAAEAQAEAAPMEMEVFYTFTWAPKPRQRPERGGERAPRPERKEGDAPRAFEKLSRRAVPANGLYFSCTCLLLGAVLIYLVPNVVEAFTLVTTVSAVLFMFVWTLILLSYLKYRKDRAALHQASNYKMPGGRFMCYVCLVFFAFILVLLSLEADTRSALVVTPIWFVLLFVALADMGPDLQMLIFTISLDNFSSGLATSAFVAYLSSLTNLKFSATQYALLSSIMLLLPRLIGGYSGVMVEKFGYHNFFLITCMLGVPTLLLIALHWYQENRRIKLNPPAED